MDDATVLAIARAIHSWDCRKPSLGPLAPTELDATALSGYVRFVKTAEKAFVLFDAYMNSKPEKTNAKK